MQETYIEQILNELTLEEKIGMIHGAGLFRTEGGKAAFHTAALHVRWSNGGAGRICRQ